MNRWLTIAALVASAGCTNVQLDPPRDIIHARFDPEAKVIPMPSDVLRDAQLGRLDLPVDDEDLTDAEREFYTFLNTMDGWSSAMSATVEFTGPVAPGTIDADTVQVWHWRQTPQRVDGVTMHLDPTETELTIDPPRDGWPRGGRFVIVVRGGVAGVEGKRGEVVEADAAFYFLRLTERLDTPEHERAFPGETREERQKNAADLEKIRQQLSPMFDFFEQRGIVRNDVAALWSFTITERTELAMDKTSQRMPLPINLLLDPDTGKVDLPPASWDSPTVLDAKARLAEVDGFGTSANLMFGFTGPVDASTITKDTVRLLSMTDPPRVIDADVAVLDDGMNVEVMPVASPLAEGTSYAVVVSDGVRDVDGEPIALMPVGHFLRSRSALYAGGSTVGVVDDDDARRLERVRLESAPILDAVGRSNALSAWSFTTMDVVAPIEELVSAPEQLGVSPNPANIEHMTPGQALLDFPFAIASLLFVDDVYQGTIESPVFLDPLTRAFRSDGGHEVQDIHFTMTVPSVEPGKPVPVVIFGHGVMTERRFVLAVGDALAARGFAAIAIDLPYHGERTYCWHEGPLSVPNPQTGELTPLTQPCEDGYTCRDDGRCVNSAGDDDGLRKWPVLGMYQASGAAFLEIEHIANTRDHFRQALVDLSALSRSLRKGDWESVIGAPIDDSRLFYAGQSLGGILGATYIAVAPEIDRAVLNVPGADTVDLFDDSPFFGGQIDAFFTREGVDRDSFDGHRFLNVARWLMDATDPHNFVGPMAASRDVMVQMATLDFIIPNEYTRKLATLADVPRRDYIAEHGFLAIPIEPEYLRGASELAGFLAGEFTP